MLKKEAELRIADKMARMIDKCSGMVRNTVEATTRRIGLQIRLAAQF